MFRDFLPLVGFMQSNSTETERTFLRLSRARSAEGRLGGCNGRCNDGGSRNKEKGEPVSRGGKGRTGQAHNTPQCGQYSCSIRCLSSTTRLGDGHSPITARMGFAGESILRGLRKHPKPRA